MNKGISAFVVVALLSIGCITLTMENNGYSSDTDPDPCVGSLLGPVKPNELKIQLTAFVQSLKGFVRDVVTPKTVFFATAAALSGLADGYANDSCYIEQDSFCPSQDLFVPPVAVFKSFANVLFNNSIGNTSFGNASLESGLTPYDATCPAYRVTPDIADIFMCDDIGICYAAEMVARTPERTFFITQD